MSGHSKWANTKHRKAHKDAKKSKLFTKIIQDLVTASKLGGTDPKLNPKLRKLISKALLNNMSKAIIEKSIYRGSKIQYKDVPNDGLTTNNLYTAYGNKGEFILIQLSNKTNLGNINKDIINYFQKQVYFFIEKTFHSCYKTFYSFLCDITKFTDKKIILDFFLNTQIEDISWEKDFIIKIILEHKYYNILKNMLINKDIILIKHKLEIIPINKICLKNKDKEIFLKLVCILTNNSKVTNILHNIRL